MTTLELTIEKPEMLSFQPSMHPSPFVVLF